MQRDEEVSSTTLPNISRHTSQSPAGTVEDIQKVSLLALRTFPTAYPLSTDADDAHSFIKHLSPDPAIVFGSSSGAIVAQRLLERHLGSVEKLISHEPLCLTVLPDEIRAQGQGLFQHVYDTYCAHGPEEAINVFASGFAEGGEGQVMRNCMDSKRGHEIRANVLF